VGGPSELEPIGSGEHQVRMEFHYDGGGLAKGGDVTLQPALVRVEAPPALRG
jgi:hypothetical protein